MTKIVVFSDSHGEHTDMKYILDRVHGDADYVLHLGDGAADVERLSANYPRIGFVNVRGNCDWGFGSNVADIQRTLDIDGVRIFMCHGHKHDVVCGDMTVLAASARANNADIALFGHTHYSEILGVKRSDSEEDGEIRIMNPGSITRPRGGAIKGKSYGLIIIDEKGDFQVSLCAFD
ncbi:MAG: metallophosphoesterase [Clostridia bacterium]|nr:metallophosphoesterase [Clostridia bacterium]